MNNGWIKLHRKLRENPIYSNSTAVHCWIECLLRAIHTDNAIFLSRQRVELKPGQFCMGREEFGKSVGISGSTAWFWLKRFKLDSMVDIKTSNVGTVVTVLKWKDYQILDSDVDKRKTADEQRMNTNNNDKNEKNLYINENPLSEDSSFEKEMQDREQLQEKEEPTTSLGEQYVKDKIDNAKPQMTQEFQVQALELIKALNIPQNRRSAYFLAVKKYPRNKILDAFAFVADYPKPEMKDKMFFWKLNKKDEKT